MRLGAQFHSPPWKRSWVLCTFGGPALLTADRGVEGWGWGWGVKRARSPKGESHKIWLTSTSHRSDLVAMSCCARSPVNGRKPTEQETFSFQERAASTLPEACLGRRLSMRAYTGFGLRPNYTAIPASAILAPCGHAVQMRYRSPSAFPPPTTKTL